MNGLTHTGVDHYVRWSDGETLSPAYPPEDLIGTVDVASRVALLATVQIAVIAQRLDIAQAVQTDGKALLPPRRRRQDDAPAD